MSSAMCEGITRDGRTVEHCVPAPGGRVPGGDGRAFQKQGDSIQKYTVRLIGQFAACLLALMSH